MVSLTSSPDMTLDVYRERKTTTQQQQSLDDESISKEPLTVVMLICL